MNRDDDVLVTVEIADREAVVHNLGAFQKSYLFEDEAGLNVEIAREGLMRGNVHKLERPLANLDHEILELGDRVLWELFGELLIALRRPVGLDEELTVVEREVRL